MSILLHAMLLLFFLASFRWVGGKMQDVEYRNHYAILVPIVYWVVGSIHAVFHQQYSDVASLAIVIFLPAVIMLGTRDEEVSVLELLALLVLVLPFKFGLIKNAVGSCNLPINIWCGAFAAVHTFVLRHRWTNVKWEWKLKPEEVKNKTIEDLLVVLIAFFILLVVLTPIGYHTGFLSVKSTDAIKLKDAPLMLLGIFTARAFGEEVPRAILQDWLKNKFNNTVVEIILSAIIFGLFHLSSATRWAGWENISYTYSFLAFGAGIGYATVYRLCGTIWAPVLLHTLVDWDWTTWFVTHFK